MPHTKYLNSIPKRDGAWAGAWASTSLPRLCLLVCDGAMAPTPSAASRLHGACVSPLKEKRAEPPGGARKFQHGLRTPRWLDLAAAGRADARRHAGVSRRGDVPRASAARSN